ncbi:hypothetical protein ACFU93_38520 [Streptomyces sp. NPDC057611]|uniref:hypothetical protein n=1 Tax=Streptomyces sp. NPDC057611 TaxID=3346182 RepID=UPI0036AA7C67
MTRFVVRVRDVNGREYTPPYFVARYASNPGPGEVRVPTLARLAPGVPMDLHLVDDSVNLTVGTEASGFSGETFNVRKVGGRWLADMRAATISMQGDTVAVDVVDGTVRLAPTVFIPPEQKVKENPRALLCEPGQGWIYYGAWLINPTISRLRNPVVFDNATPAGYPSDVTKVNNDGSGSLVFLEWGFEATPGAPRGPRFLIAVWAPRVVLGTPPQVVVFYTPPTKVTDYPADAYPFRGRYPYYPRPDVAVAPTIAKDLVQPYAYLAINYLIAGYKIIPQIQAAGRNPVVIFPVHPSANWGPLGTQRGLSRLVKEVLCFLYGRKLVSNRVAPTARLSLDAGRASIFPSEGLFDDEPIPTRWALTVSAFSNGIDRALDLCTSHPIDETLYDPAIFSSPEAALVESWREIWDIDGVADDGKGAERHLRNLQTWLKEAERRAVRSYHSGEGMRTAPRALVDPAFVETRPAKSYKGVRISEGSSADKRATWVEFSDAALQPSPYDAHHTVPAIAFGHAAQFALP